MSKKGRSVKIAAMVERAHRACEEQFKDPKVVAQCKYGVDQLERTIRTALAPRSKKG
jgi:hypothetical protein